MSARTRLSGANNLSTVNPRSTSRSERIQVLLVALVGVGSALALAIFFAARLSTPGDSTQVPIGSSYLTVEGLPIKLLFATSDGLKENDVVTAIEGREVNDWVRDNFTGKWDSGALLEKRALQYTVLRNGKLQAVQVQLAPFPLTRVPGEGSATEYALLLMVAFALFVFIQRPLLWHAQLFFIAIITFVAGAVIYAIWHQVSDLLRGWVIPFEVIAHALLYFFGVAALLHFFLVFPRRHPILVHHPRLVVWCYLGIYLIYATAFLIRLPAAHTPAALLQLDVASAFMTTLYYPLILIAIVTNYRHLADETERRQILWIFWGTLVALGGIATLTAISFAFGFPAQSYAGWAGIFLIAIPLSFAIAILRENLFDINLILNRTLV